MIIGVDPGKMTGVWVMVDTDHVIGVEKPALEALVFIESAMSHVPGNTHIIFAVERYDIGVNTVKLTRQYEAMEVIGAIKYLAHRRGECLVEMQSRSVKTRVSNDVLRKLNWWTAGSAGHMHDAQRHALVAATKYTPWHDLVKRAYGIMS